MSRIKFVSVFVLLALLLSVVPDVALAQEPNEPDGDEQAPVCIDMPEAQISGEKPGSACRVPIVPSGKFADPNVESIGPLAVYRSGWTYQWASESDSDLLEDRIKVEGYLYWEVGGSWHYDDQCTDDNYWSHHAACRTYGQGHLRQRGYHYFRKSGYYDQSFWSLYEWTTN